MPPTRVETLVLHPTPGTRVVADRLPGTTPAWVYLHGLTSVRAGEKSAALFAFAAARGEAAWRFDFRGHGGSSGALADITLTELVDDSVAVLREAGPSLLVGSSLGGLVAAWTAARHPQLVTGLVLLAPAFRFLPRLTARLDPWGRMTLPHGDGELRFAPRVLEDFARYDEAALPGAIRQPTLVVHGALDDTVPIEASRQFVEHLRAARKELWEVADGDHRLNRPIAAILDRAARFHGRDNGRGRADDRQGDCAS